MDETRRLTGLLEKVGTSITRRILRHLQLSVEYMNPWLWYYEAKVGPASSARRHIFLRLLFRPTTTDLLHLTWARPNPDILPFDYLTHRRRWAGRIY